MLEKIYLHLLILLCGILSLEIIASLSDEDTRESSDFLIRKRRVINRLTHGRNALRIEQVNYLVKIKESNRGICAGAILSRDTVITASSCIRRVLSMYQVQSGSVGNTGFNLHNVTSNIQYFGNPPHLMFDGISLITVDPPFEFTRRVGHIQLYIGPLLPAGTYVTVFGWGYLNPVQCITELRQRLRSIILPIMNHEECQTVYRGRVHITEKHICTYHPEQYCARNDEGAPLIFNQKLVGIHSLKGEYENLQNPDVFIDLQRPEYIDWIREHTQ